MRLTPDPDTPEQTESADQEAREHTRAFVTGLLTTLHPFDEPWDATSAGFHAEAETQLTAIRTEHEWLTTRRQPPTADPLDVLGAVLDRLRDTLGEPDRVWCGSGWHRLVAETDRRLAAIDPDYQLISAKEKFGSLTLWARPAAHSSISDQQRQLFASIISAAESASAFICEICGRTDAHLRGTPPWRVRTLCESHATWGVRP